jgi:hypothetical protein
MRNRYITALLAAGIMVWSVQALAATDFTMNLDSAQEVAIPPVVSNGSGFGTMTLVDLGGGQFRWDYSITISSHFNFRNFSTALDNGGRDVTGFHIHNANRGANGGVVYGVHSPSHASPGSVSAILNPDNSTTFTGSWTALDGNPVGNINTYGPSLLAAPIGDVPFYWNVHTAAYPAGEIRGQIVAIPEPATLGLAAIALLGLRRFRR